MLHSLLDILDRVPGVPFIPLPVERLGYSPELHDQVAGQVLRLDFGPFLPRQKIDWIVYLKMSKKKISDSLEREPAVVSAIERPRGRYRDRFLKPEVQLKEKQSGI
jgi:hypothetical protein